MLKDTLVKMDVELIILGNKYLKGVAIRQDYLATIINWISNNNIKQYMAINQNNKTAKDLWNYFVNVMEWVKKIFS